MTMASEQKAPEDFYFNTSDDEVAYDASDSTTLDDSYLAHLSERMEKSPSPPEPRPAPPDGKEKGAKKQKGNDGAEKLPGSFSPSFAEESKDNPLGVEPVAIPSPPRPAQAPPTLSQDRGGAKNDIIELGDDAIESLNDSAENAQPNSPAPPLGSGPPSSPPSQRPSGPPRPSQPISTGPSDLLKTVPPPPEDLEPYDPELDPATYDAPTFVRPSLIEQDPVPVIEILQGNEGGRSYRFEKEVVTIGRSLDNDVVVTDIAVSRRHTKLARQGNNVFVEDMGSGNGTIVNGVKVPRSPVGSADRIEVGNTIFRIVFPGAESFPTDAVPLGAQANPQSGPLHQKSTMYLNDGNQVLQQIGLPQQGQQMGMSTGQGPIMAVSPSPAITLPPNQDQTPHFQALPAPLMSPSMQVEQAHSLQKSSPRSFKLAMAVLAVVMLFIGALAIVAAMIHLQNRSTAAGAGGSGSEQLTAEDLFEAGTKAYVERRWGQAADAFEQVLALDQANTKASDSLNKVRAEERNQGTVEAARQAIADKNYDVAITTLATISRASVYFTEADTIGREAKHLFSKQLTTEAERFAESDPELALEKVDRALKLHPTNSPAREIQERLNKTATASDPETPPEEGPTVAIAPTKPPHSSGGGSRRPPSNAGKRPQRPDRTPSKSSEAVSSILTQYKSGNFSGAIARAKELTASGSEADRQKARSLERQISRFQAAWQGARSSGNPRQKMNHLEQALRLDRGISGGHFGPQIRPMLREEYVSNAQRAWRAGQYASACQSAMRALKLDRGAAGASSLMQKCETKARDFYNQGDRLRRSDLNQAKSYWRKVLNMVPRNNPYYAKAYQAVNNAGRGRFQDEDE